VQKDRQRGVPLRAIHAAGGILGTLSLGRQTSQTFGEREAALVEPRDQIGIALDNAACTRSRCASSTSFKRAQASSSTPRKLSPSASWPPASPTRSTTAHHDPGAGAAPARTAD